MPKPDSHSVAMLNRQVFLFHNEEGWVVSCPSLPGCHSQGSTQEEALANIRDAIEGYIASLEEDGLSVPPDRSDASLVTV